MSRAQELEEAVRRMNASATSIRASIEQMVEVLRDTSSDHRSGDLRSAWRRMTDELTAAAETASRALLDH